VTYRVLNETASRLTSRWAGHPAFRVPLLPGEDYADYYLEFDADAALDRHLISGGTATLRARPGRTARRPQVAPDERLFNEDALVFQEPAIPERIPAQHQKPPRAHVSYPAFPYLGIWAKPAAPFVCIEPWLGCADTEGKPVPIEEKELIQFAAPGDTFEATFSIRIS
jgi:galactose mutarotase-like enzyme